VTDLVLVQADPFFALEKINKPVTDGLDHGKQVAAGNDDHDGGVCEGVCSQLVIPLGKVFTILLAHFAMAAFGGAHGAQLEYIITDTVTNNQVEKQYQYIHQAQSGSLPMGRNV